MTDHDNLRAAGCRLRAAVRGAVTGISVARAGSPARLIRRQLEGARGDGAAVTADDRTSSEEPESKPRLRATAGLSRRATIIVLTAALAAGCASIKPDPRYNRSRPGSETARRDRSESTAERAEEGKASPVETAGAGTDNLDGTIESWWGTPYRYGGSKKDVGVDCSAYVKAVYKTVYGIDLPRHSTAQYRTGREVTRSELKRGDLVFFNTSGRGVSHVGIYLGGGLFTHASNSDGVTIDRLSSPYYGKRYVGARRIR
ncbi:MAG: Murein DD-endopeptidase MepS/Murein LD-carboxypeptidase [Calditrichaeota bacterium]|nr:Murein DD-endopeptidase MepS/Murein LD-carboxypeptidase [Calditrichota bacterium]